jgi:hypothetical protein
VSGKIEASAQADALNSNRSSAHILPYTTLTPAGMRILL